MKQQSSLQQDCVRTDTIQAQTKKKPEIRKPVKSKFAPKFDPEQFFKTLRGMPRSTLVKLLETYIESRDSNKAVGYPVQHIEESINEIRMELSCRPVGKSGTFDND